MKMNSQHMPHVLPKTYFRLKLVCFHWQLHLPAEDGSFMTLVMSGEANLEFAFSFHRATLRIVLLKPFRNLENLLVVFLENFAMQRDFLLIIFLPQSAVVS